MALLVIHTDVSPLSVIKALQAAKQEGNQEGGRAAATLCNAACPLARFRMDKSLNTNA